MTKPPPFRLNRMDQETPPPPNYRDINLNEADSNQLVIDWLLRKTNSDVGGGGDHTAAAEIRSQSIDSSPSSHLTVVRIESGSHHHKPPPTLLLTRLPPSQHQRCFVCDELINEPPTSNNDEAIYICDGCYESWYSAPVGLSAAAPTRLLNQPPNKQKQKQRDENESPETVSSTIYSLTKDNKLKPPPPTRKRNSNF